jgi:phage host-nuclease inhibitor protein Gam
MNRLAPIAILPIVICCSAFVHAADLDTVSQNLDKAKAAFEARIDGFRKEILQDLDKNEIAARQVPDKKRIDQIKAQRLAFQATGLIPASINPQIATRIRNARAVLEREYTAARNSYLRTKQDAKADAIDKELEEFRKGAGAKPQDLLPLIDIKRDTLRGRWERDGVSIISADPGYSSLQLPLQPPREYVLEVTVAKLAGGNDFQIALIAGDQRCTVVLDGFAGQVSGISAIDAKPFDQNETTIRGALLPDNQAVVVTATIRVQQISIAVGNRTVIDFKGDEKRLTLGQDETGTDKHFLFIGVQHGGRYRIDAINLKPLVGEGTLKLPPAHPQ